MAGLAGSSRPVDAADAADLRKEKGPRDRPAQSSVYTMVSSEESKREREKRVQMVEYVSLLE
jgi:hypothetical protein